ncbi:MAG TPA: hypothetical protein VGV89_06915 [Thermoplasmata archaeon]|nr:hypothetical protein [Thermoplasmata archaeon]
MVGSERVHVRIGPTEYECIDPWGELSDPEVSRAWPHSAVAWTSSGHVWTFHPARSSLLRLDADGAVVSEHPVPIAEAHGIFAAREGAKEYLWLADASVKRRPESGYQPTSDDSGSVVVKCDLAGNVVQSLPRPVHSAYHNGPYRPTWVGVCDPNHGGSGDVWVADGYGQSLVHRYDAAGRLLGSLSGEEGAGRFKGPHIAFLDTRREEPEMYIADRGNARIQVYGMDGRFRRVVGAGMLSSPTSFAIDGPRLLVMEYYPPRMLVLDATDSLVGIVGENLKPLAQPSFPFVRDSEGKPTPPAGMGSGRFGIPHSVTVDGSGNLYFTDVAFGSHFSKWRRVAVDPQ